MKEENRKGGPTGGSSVQGSKVQGKTRTGKLLHGLTLLLVRSYVFITSASVR